MVIDTSAILAILFEEKESQTFAALIANDAVRLMAAPTLTECLIVLEAKKGSAATRELELLLHKTSMDIVAFTAEQAMLAHMAWQHYGKGRHPAALNLGDCFSYALAKHTGEPLLFKGLDFDKTDVLSVGYYRPDP